MLLRPSPLTPSLLFFDRSLSAAAFNKMGLLLIFVSVLIRANDSAVELVSTKSSTLFGSRTLAKMESCKEVGVTKTTYSSGASLMNDP
jgi:hypothetical protein